jgi:CRP-like cAMP-binding protein
MCDSTAGCSLSGAGALHSTNVNLAKAAQNGFLSELAPARVAALRPHLRPAELAAGALIHRAGEPANYVHFLEGGLARTFAGSSAGNVIGTSLVGMEGVLGLAAVLAGQPAAESAHMLAPGRALRIEAGAFRRLCREEADLSLAASCELARQNAELQIELGCCAHHTISQRLARALLAAHRKLPGEPIPVTQEDLALMLGVQRTTVTALARQLKREGVIAYGRGSVRVRDERRLETASCGCGGVRATAGSVGGWDHLERRSRTK